MAKNNLQKLELTWVGKGEEGRSASFEKRAKKKAEIALSL